jgi:hypothetical protein
VFSCGRTSFTKTDGFLRRNVVPHRFGASMKMGMARRRRA